MYITGSGRRRPFPVQSIVFRKAVFIQEDNGMKDFSELKELVRKKGFGTALYGNVNGTPVYLSRGIRELYLGSDGISEVTGAVVRFLNGDFGSAAQFGKTGKAGHEYGRYEICDLPCSDREDSGVWVHRAEDAVIVYFSFER
jgi:hypothetical protein